MKSAIGRHLRHLNSLNLSPKSSYRLHGLTSVFQVRPLTSETVRENEEPRQGVRSRLTTELKSAMKARNTFATTVLRSVLAEVYTGDKTPSGPISDSQVTSILRKAMARREESAAQFATASRNDLAEAERQEAKYLETFLPPSMSESDIDAILHKIVVEQELLSPKIDAKRALGVLLKTFFGQVDKALVDAQTVKQRAQVLLDGREQ